jgi:hypothetical protein
VAVEAKQESYDLGYDESYDEAEKTRFIQNTPIFTDGQFVYVISFIRENKENEKGKFFPCHIYSFIYRARTSWK